MELAVSLRDMILGANDCRILWSQPEQHSLPEFSAEAHGPAMYRRFYSAVPNLIVLQLRVFSGSAAESHPRQELPLSPKVKQPFIVFSPLKVLPPTLQH